MNSKRDFFMDAFMNLIWLTVFYGLFVVPAVLLLYLRTDVLFLVSATVSFCLFMARRAIRPILPMVLMHLIFPVAAFYFAPDIFSRVLYIGVTLVLVVFSLQQRHNRAPTFSSGFIYVAPIIFIVFALVLGYQGHGYMYNLYAVLMVFACVGSKLHIRMTQVNDSLEVITQTSTQPVKKILAFDYKAMVIFSVILVGLILFLHIFLMRPALEVVSGIRVNMQLDPSFGEEADAPAPAPPIGGMGMGLGELGYREPSLILRFMERLLMLAIPPLIALGLGIVLFRVARNIYRRLGLKGSHDHEHASGYEDIKEFIRAPKLKRSWFFGPRNEHKLRKLFRETMTRHIKKGVPIRKTDTPAEMAGKIQAEDVNSLVEEYVVVRYGS